MTYNVHDHIAKARAKDEEWGALCIEFFLAKVQEKHPFAINQQTLDTLKLLSVEQQELRDNFEPFSLDFQTEWSRLVVVDCIIKQVELALEDLKQ